MRKYSETYYVTRVLSIGTIHLKKPWRNNETLKVKTKSKNSIAYHNYADCWRVAIFTGFARILLELSKIWPVKSVASVVQKIFCNLFFMQKA